jgi:hypothetical protein
MEVFFFFFFFSVLIDDLINKATQTGTMQSLKGQRQAAETGNKRQK